MGVILEVAARNQLLKQAGTHAARRFALGLTQGLGVDVDPEPEQA
jgi:hypothetical protein